MKLNYFSFGSGNRNMIILPGLSLRPVSLSADEVVKAYGLFCDDYTVYVFDQREDIDESYNLDNMGEDLIEAIEELELKDLYILGVSMGGMIAQKLLIERNNLIKKIVLVSTVHKINENKSLIRWLEAIDNNDVKKLIYSFTQDVYSNAFYEKYKDVIYESYKNIDIDELIKLRIRINAAKDLDLENGFDNKIPIMLIGSKKDNIFTYEQMLETVKYYNCEYYFYDEYSHAIYDEAIDIKKRIYDFYLS